MQEIRYDEGDRTVIDRIVGRETTEFRKKLEERRAELEKKIQAAEVERARITEHRRIGRNDPCPCGSKVKFKKCCGARLEQNDARIKESTPND